MQQHNVAYCLFFVTAVCIVSAVFVSVSAVTLRERQEANEVQDKMRNVLLAAGLANDDESLSREEVDARFAPIRRVVIDLATGEEVTDVDADNFDQQELVKNPETSREVPANRSRVRRTPNQALVYHLLDESGELRMLILPVEGQGLWSTLYGFLAIDVDLDTIRGITFYQHGETPGLGGEVDNPRWKALWPGRKAFDENLNPRIAVIKGRAGPAEEDPYQVDGLSGATLTSNGVTNLLQFWLGEHGFGSYLEKMRESRSEA